MYTLATYPYYVSPFLYFCDISVSDDVLLLDGTAIMYPPILGHAVDVVVVVDGYTPCGFVQHDGMYTVLILASTQFDRR